MFSKREKIFVLATGGTISGVSRAGGASYSAGVLSVEELLSGVPEVFETFDVQSEQIANVASQNVTEPLWIRLAIRIRELFSGKNFDGGLILHGTDTMEETAFFLHLVLRGKGPLILTGSMRPATANTPDGPGNIISSLHFLSALINEKKRGVFCSLAGKIFSAVSVQKMHTVSLDAFTSIKNEREDILNGEIDGLPDFSLHLQEEFPSVEIFYAYAGARGFSLEELCARKVRGIIISGVGCGNMGEALLESSRRAASSNICVVRSTRVPFGGVSRNVEIDDDKENFIAANSLNPQKARILLMLMLTVTSDIREIQKAFDRF